MVIRAVASEFLFLQRRNCPFRSGLTDDIWSKVAWPSEGRRFGIAFASGDPDVTAGGRLSLFSLLHELIHSSPLLSKSSYTNG